MAFNFNGTQANVTISGGITTAIPAPSAAQVLKIIDTSQTDIIASTGITLYTVTAGKTFYMTKFAYSASASIAGLVIRDGSTTELSGDSPTWTTARQTCNIEFPTPIPFTTNVNTFHGALGIAVGVNYFILGWEQ